MKRAGIFDRRSALNRKANQLNSVLGNSRIGKDSDGFENLDEYFASSPRRDVPLVSTDSIANATAVKDTKNINNDNNYDEYNPLSPTNIPLTEMEVQSDNNLLLKNANSIHHHNYKNDNNDDDSHNFEDNNTMQEDFGDLPAFDDFQDDEDTAGRSDVNQSDDDDEVVVRDSIPVRLSMPLAPPASQGKKKTQQKMAASMTTSTTKPKPLRRLAAIIPEADDADDDTSYKRRSNRKRMEPLQYWAGERPKYGRRESSRMPVIVDILPPTTKIAPPRRAVQRRKSKAASNASAGATAAAAKAQSTTPKGPVSILANLKGVSGFKADVNFTGTVMDFDEHVEMDRLLALGPDNVDLKTVTNENFMIQSIFSEAGTLSSGVLHFPPRTAKESRNSLNHCLVCYVIEGTFQITIHQNVFIVGTGSQFIVPRGNQYSIKSLWDKDGRLFFAHCTIGEKQ